jgi:hypothetical protein
MLLLDIQKNIVFNFVKLRISNSNLLNEQGRHVLSSGELMDTDCSQDKEVQV